MRTNLNNHLFSTITSQLDEAFGLPTLPATLQDELEWYAYEFCQKALFEHYRSQFKHKEKLIDVAITQIRNSGGQPYWSWYGFGSRVEWCACFVSWCANECGYIDAGVVPKFASCDVGMGWFKDHSRWQTSTYTPREGDIIFFDQDSDGLANHVGIVEKVEDSKVHTIEGNSSDACKRLQYNLGDSRILGYGVPAY